MFLYIPQTEPLRVGIRENLLSTCRSVSDTPGAVPAVTATPGYQRPVDPNMASKIFSVTS